MAAVAMSVEQYLKSTFEPDAEFVDGFIEERPMGEHPHSRWQTAIILFFGTRAREWNLRVRPELRTQTGERRYRIPDIALIDADVIEEPYATHPPLAVFEILSPEDRLPRLLIRIADFERMGVQSIYLVDPVDGTFLRFQDNRLTAEQTLSVAGKIIDVQEVKNLLW